MRNGFQRFGRAGLVLAMSFVWAGPAPARDGGRHGDHRDRHYSRHDDGDRHRGYSRHDSRRDRHYNRHDRHRGHRRHYARGHRGRHHDTYRGAPRYYHGDSSYYCASCRHRFHSRGRFHDHLTGHHHVPLWQLPFVITHGLVHGIFGWVFHG